MSNANNTLEEVLISPYIENYEGAQNDVGYISEINNFNIISATELKFNFKMPDDNINGQVVIYEGIIINDNKEPVYRANLDSHEGTVTVNPGDLNFLKGAYTIAITADKNLNTVAATQSILSGQQIQQGMSSLTVIGKNLTSINTVFNRPSNAIASSDITWLIIREGTVLGSGNTKARQTSTPGASSGLVPVNFLAGTLKEGQMYNVILNPGNTTQTFTAGFVFKYVIQ